MIIRIVKMTFKPEKVNEFIHLFDSSSHKIRAMEGCRHLELLREEGSGNVFFTYSYWESEAFLNSYRESELFAGVWSQTKALFSDKPQAWTVNRLRNL